MRESIVKIGGPVPLAGVLTEAESGLGEGRRDRADVALLLLNSGIMHRVGACGLSVRVARAAAVQVGLQCLRFDFSGIGDSESRRAGGVDFDQAAVDEVIEAMDDLQTNRQVHRFVLYGLCSGALIACRAAERDPRVVAVAQIDGCSYPTLRSYLNYYSKRICSPRRWRRRLSRLLPGLREEERRDSILVGGKADFEIPEFAEDPGKDKVAAQLQALMERDVNLHCVFTGREPYFCYRGQYRDCFRHVDFGSRLSVDYYPEASHIFTEPVYQQQMVAELVRWMDRVV